MGYESSTNNTSNVRTSSEIPYLFATNRAMAISAPTRAHAASPSTATTPGLLSSPGGCTSNYWESCRLLNNRWQYTRP